MLGELSSARDVLESGEWHLAILSTLRALTDPEKRPPVSREAVPRVDPATSRTLPVGRGQVGCPSRRGTGAIKDDERTLVSFVGV